MALKTVFDKKYFWCSLLIFVIGLFFIVKTIHEPIRDFGNYYYASKLLADGNYSVKIHEDIHYFNSQIAAYGEKNFFENYAPVPPFSLVFYLPFVYMKAATAKVIFNAFGLILLCLSVYRFIKTAEIKTNLLYLVPLVFIFPLYQNIYQGQFYLIALSLLIETFLLMKKDRWFPASILFAVLVSVKLFPVLFLVYFIVKRKFKMVAAGFAIIVLLHLLLLSFMDVTILLNYFSDTLPRLFQNDIVGSYHATNQSFHALWMNVFSGDELWNKNVLAESPYLIPILESLIAAIILAFYFNADKRKDVGFFSLTAFIIVLVGRYNASYAMLMLLPLYIYLSQTFINKVLLLGFFLVTALAWWIPVNSLNEYPLIIKFSRILLLGILFGVLVWQLKIRFSLIYFSVFFTFLISIRLLSFKADKSNYFALQNTSGVLYDLSYENDSLVLNSCMGDKDVVEKFYLPGNVELLTTESILIDRRSGGENIKKGFRLNDSLIVYMSDKRQGLRMYKLQQLRLR